LAKPDDRKAKDKLEATIKANEAALAAIPAATNPSLDNDLIAAAKEEQARLADNLVKVEEGDKAGVADGNKKIADKQKEVLDLLNKAADASTNPSDKDKLHKIGENLGQLQKQLVDASNKSVANPSDQDAAQDVRDITKNG